MKKDRLSELVSRVGIHPPHPELDPRYAGFFKCFNEQLYFEAHDVLEDLWLQDLTGASLPANSTNYHFFKGLIQIAGAFVHLQKQRARPHHPKDGRRTRPAARLFQLAADNLAGYRPVHMRLNVEELWLFCVETKRQIERSNFELNPWSPASPPRLQLIS